MLSKKQRKIKKIKETALFYNRTYEDNLNEIINGTKENRIDIYYCIVK